MNSLSIVERGAECRKGCALSTVVPLAICIVLSLLCGLGCDKRATAPKKAKDIYEMIPGITEADLVVFEGRLESVDRMEDDPDWKYWEVLQVRVTRSLQQLPHPDTIINVIVTRPGMSAPDIFLTVHDAGRLKVGNTYRITATEALPKGWDPLKPEYDEMFLGMVAGLGVEKTDY